MKQVANEGQSLAEAHAENVDILRFCFRDARSSDRNDQDERSKSRRFNFLTWQEWVGRDPPKIVRAAQLKIHFRFEASQKSEAIPAHALQFMVGQKSRPHAVVSVDLDSVPYFSDGFVLLSRCKCFCSDSEYKDSSRCRLDLCWAIVRRCCAACAPNREPAIWTLGRQIFDRRFDALSDTLADSVWIWHFPNRGTPPTYRSICYSSCQPF
ncbi:hypothetical protein CONLIGDRAFT_97203 [Coniochaeta ligniaria NRRL 30616]|uniref:Uncharacterized protein n=1 Tax=Coniochaeta ligniaria NRRL 30616 TaxID=1408157 RepID=A0A1J7IAU5_9PEZI|nr:hypothetical protein CONLIGDRAFT_97203 [Coniochaeta ligniaria NRRL 30616]